MEFAIAKLSSKGQIVIPERMRKKLKKGDEMVFIQNKDQIILKPAKKFSKRFLEDLEFARRTEEAYKRYERGEFIEMDYDEFLKKLEKW
ncbi:MAG: AbrB/MazE/SpoVT family DNA-binding domain-containing protein [Nanoarchaeota archaeon]|nr:AbrB/MazE/SpoVT family DNA-binding domain-containing protein [Nanoarchaeota archaeon]